MHLYKVDSTERDCAHVVARDPHEAAQIFVTWCVAHGHDHERFTVECVRLTNLHRQQQVQVRGAIVAGLVGVCHFDEEIGWTFSPPMWVPLGVGEQPVGDEGASL